MSSSEPLASSPTSLARPKSSSFAVPSSVTITLPGFRSRCRIPAAWAPASASAICRAMRSVSFRAQPVARDHPVECPAADLLHHQVGDTVALAHVVERDDVRVIERGDRLRLTQEPPPPDRIVSVPRGQNLDRHLTLQARVARAVDVAHAPGAEGDRISYGPRRVPAARVIGPPVMMVQRSLPAAESRVHGQRTVRSRLGRWRGGMARWRRRTLRGTSTCPLGVTRGGMWATPRREGQRGASRRGARECAAVAGTRGWLAPATAGRTANAGTS